MYHRFYPQHGGSSVAQTVLIYSRLLYRAASLGFQTIIFGLTIVRWLTHLMVTKQLGKRSIMYVFMRDGGWAYGVMLGE